MRLLVYPVGQSWYWRVIGGSATVAECPNPFRDQYAAAKSAKNFARRMNQSLPQVEVRTA